MAQQVRRQFELNESYERGKTLFLHKRYDLAEKELRRSLVDEPHNPVTYSILAQCLCRQEKLNEALREAQDGVGLGPDIFYCHYALAQVLNERNQLSEARAAILEAIRLHPESADCFFELALVEYRTHHATNALKAIERALQIDPDNTVHQNLRIQILSEYGSSATAIAAIKQTLAANPNDALAHSTYGWIFLERREFEKARAHFEQALRLQPDHFRAKEGMAELLKANSRVYRFLLNYVIWAGNVKPAIQWAALIGGYAVVRILAAVEGNPTPLWLRIIAVLYVIAAASLWTARPLFNAVLLTNSIARNALSCEQIVESALICPTSVLAIACGAYYITVDSTLAAVAGSVLGVTGVLINRGFRCCSGWPRQSAFWIVLAFAAYATLVITFFLSGIALSKQTASAMADFIFPIAVFLGVAINTLATFSPRR